MQYLEEGCTVPETRIKNGCNIGAWYLEKGFTAPVVPDPPCPPGLPLQVQDQAAGGPRQPSHLHHLQRVQQALRLFLLRPQEDRGRAARAGGGAGQCRAGARARGVDGGAGGADGGTGAGEAYGRAGAGGEGEEGAKGAEGQGEVEGKGEEGRPWL